MPRGRRATASPRRLDYPSAAVRRAALIALAARARDTDLRAWRPSEGLVLVLVIAWAILWVVAGVLAVVLLGSTTFAATSHQGRNGK